MIDPINVSDVANESDETVELDEKKFRRMLTKIYNLERQNSKTEKLTEKKIKEAIQKIIEEEADKCY